MQALLTRRGHSRAAAPTTTTTAPPASIAPVAAPAAAARRRRRARSPGSARAAAADPSSSSSPWQPVVDTATQRTYWWNRDTNVTQWEDPAVVPAAAPAAAPGPASGGRGTFGGASSAAAAAAAAAAAGEGAAPSREEMLGALVEAMGADGSGMAFWEAARERRRFGVFEDAYIDWLSAAVERGGEEGEVAGRVRARLVNPLLRQAAPFE